MNRATKWFEGLAITVMVVVLGVFILSAVKFYDMDRHSESAWTIVLLSIPCAIYLSIVGRLVWKAKEHDENIKFFGFLVLAMTTCVGGYSVLWFKYATGDKDSVACSYAALGLIACLIVFIAIMTCAFVRDLKAANDPGLSQALSAGVRGEPLPALATFIVLFVGLAVLFGFAFAFHDQASRTESKSVVNKEGIPALHMVNLPSPDRFVRAPAGEGGTEGGARPEANAGQNIGGAKANNGKTPANDQFRFLFDSAEAHLRLPETDEERKKVTDVCTVVEPCSLDGGQAGDGGIRAPDITTKGIFNIFAHNHCTLQALKERVKCETKKGTRVRIELIGRSDKDQPNGRAPYYPSNYELSEARAENVKFKIFEELKETDSSEWHNIEWLSLPSSDEPLGDSKNPVGLVEYMSFDDKKLAEGQYNRVVIASVLPLPLHITTQEVNRFNKEQSKPLMLMDYMYFSIYTITTTGYGDIIPTTAYAKFLSSLANICEVLLLVVFFNALVSLRRGQEPKQTSVTNANPKQPMQPGSEEQSDGQRIHPATVTPIRGQ